VPAPLPLRPQTYLSGTVGSLRRPSERDLIEDHVGTEPLKLPRGGLMAPMLSLSHEEEAHIRGNHATTTTLHTRLGT
jgi:hypothetical protein